MTDDFRAKNRSSGYVHPLDCDRILGVGPGLTLDDLHGLAATQYLCQGFGQWLHLDL